MSRLRSGVLNPVQVAAAVGVPVQGGQVAELTLLRRAIGGEGVATVATAEAVFSLIVPSGMPLLLAISRWA